MADALTPSRRAAWERGNPATASEVFTDYPNMPLHRGYPISDVPNSSGMFGPSGGGGGRPIPTEVLDEGASIARGMAGRVPEPPRYGSTLGAEMASFTRDENAARAAAMRAAPAASDGGAISDLRAIMGGAGGAASRVGSAVDGIMNSYAVNNPLTRTALRGLPLVGAGMEVANPESDARKYGAQAVESARAGHYGDAFMQGLQSLRGALVGDNNMFSGNFRDTSVGGAAAYTPIGALYNLGNAAVNSFYERQKPQPGKDPITYNEQTHEFSRAPVNMDEYKQMMAAREQARSGQPMMQVKANGRDVMLTPSEVNASALRDEILKNGLIHAPSGEVSGATQGELGNSAPKGFWQKALTQPTIDPNSPMGQMRQVYAMNRELGGNQHTLGSALAAEAALQAEKTKQPYWDAAAQGLKARQAYTPAQRAQQRVEANRDDYMTLKMARMNPTATPDQIKEIDRALALMEAGNKYDAGIYHPGNPKALDMDELYNQRQMLGQP